MADRTFRSLDLYKLVGTQELLDSSWGATDVLEIACVFECYRYAFLAYLATTEEMFPLAKKQHSLYLARNIWRNNRAIESEEAAQQEEQMLDAERIISDYGFDYSFEGYLRADDHACARMSVIDRLEIQQWSLLRDNICNLFRVVCARRGFGLSAQDLELHAALRDYQKQFLSMGNSTKARYRACWCDNKPEKHRELFWPSSIQFPSPEEDELKLDRIWFYQRQLQRLDEPPELPCVLEEQFQLLHGSLIGAVPYRV